MIKLALFNGSFIEVISCRRLKGSKHGLENDKLYYQKHRHTFYSSRIFLDRKMLYLKARFSLLQHGAFKRCLGCSVILLVCRECVECSIQEEGVSAWDLPQIIFLGASMDQWAQRYARRNSVEFFFVAPKKTVRAYFRGLNDRIS